MHVTGIIAEYNPLHLGHQYHIKQTKALTGADFIITVLSGDFVQRGLPAIIDKHTRARMALEAGSDLVLELPVPYALSSAEGFGFGGVSLLHGLGCVDTLSFGSESGDLAGLMQLAQVLSTESEAYRQAYQTALKQGLSHPAARLQAVQACYPDLDASLLDGHSNNMLALEYCKALYRLQSAIKPVTVRRRGQGYLDTFAAEDFTNADQTTTTGHVTNTGHAAVHAANVTDVKSNPLFASATAIRNILCQTNNIHAYSPDTPDVLHSLLPAHVENSLRAAQLEHALLFADDFSSLLHYKLLSLSRTALCDYWEVTPELANKIANKLPEFDCFTQFTDLLWTKDLTYARVCRCLIHILLDIKNDTRDVHQPVPYARVLGFRREAAPLLSAIKAHSSLPLITKIADAGKLLNPETYSLLSMDLKAAHIYDSVMQHKSGRKCIHEARKQIVII